MEAVRKPLNSPMNEDFLLEATVGAQQKRAAVMVARANPPTVGHYRVIDKMKAFIRNNPDLKISVPVLVIVAGEKSSQDKEHNPLSAEDRVKFIQASGRANGVQVLVAPSGFAAFEEVRKAGYEPIAVAAGSDRADRYIELLDKYFTAKDGSKLPHVKITGLDREGQDGDKKNRVGAMERALDDLKKGGELDVAEVSGSMARRAVQLGYQEEFAKIAGLEKKPKLAKLLFAKIKNTMGEADGGT
jgi:hypothetical protein